MPLTKKETLLLQDLQKEEELCIAKYKRYADQAKDTKLKDMLKKIGQHEQQHLATINEIMAGEVPKPQTSNQKPAAQQPPDLKSSATKADKESDAYLCSDLLATEKHASALYDTCVFEFANPKLRQALNTIQSQEQHHGEQVYAYMAQNKMM